MTPSASSLSTLRFTAGADSETRSPMLWNERRASWRRSATVSTQPVAAPQAAGAEDFMPLHGIDHVELYVGNALQSAYVYTHALGFREVAYAGLETGLRDRASHVLQQGRIRLVLTGSLTPGHDVGRHVAAHGDGVKVIAL